ncbi:MAG: alanine dehydrogenase [Flavobacteriales bacterium]|nr:alanine dehydrogenase [Flavobacteriales bacterium]
MEEFSKKTLSDLAKQASLQPQEKLQHQHLKNNRLCISVPKEITYQERRISLSPLSVELLVNNGHEVKIEIGSGEKANFSDIEYSNLGGQIVYDRESAFSGDIVLKVAPPTSEEIEMMKPGQILVSALQLADLKKETLLHLSRKKITAVAYEFFRDDAGTLPIIRAMSEIAGRASVLIAAEYLMSNSATNGKGELIGGIPGIPPTDVVIIGAGSVGEYAVRAALGLGAHVTVFDNSLHRLRRLEASIGRRLNSSTLLPHILQKALSQCDVAIGALRSGAGRSPIVVSETMVQKMKPHSLIVDVSIDQGGCFETSEIRNHENPTFMKHDVLHYCVPNIASRVSRTASYALSNILAPLIIEIANEGGFYSYIWADKGLRKGVYMYKGSLTNNNLGDRFGLKSQEIDFLFSGNA